MVVRRVLWEGKEVWEGWEGGVGVGRVLESTVGVGGVVMAGVGWGGGVEGTLRWCYDPVAKCSWMRKPAK